MNLFLLFAVPLTALVLYFWQRPLDPALRAVRIWGWGIVYALASLVIASFFGKGREFTGDLARLFGGLLWTDVLLVPGVVIAAWYLHQKRDPWVLALWLTLVLSLEGVRDFFGTSKTFDQTELFILPLARMLVLLIVPTFLDKALKAPSWEGRLQGWGPSALVFISAPILAVLSLAQWGLLAWALEGGALIFVGWTIHKKGFVQTLPTTQAIEAKPQAPL